MTTATHSPFAAFSLRGAVQSSAPLDAGRGLLARMRPLRKAPSLTQAEWDAVMAKLVTGLGFLIVVAALVAASSVVTAADYTVVAETVVAGADGLVTVYDGRY
ncbi:MAG: hypothetical protein AAF321_04050 [Pseudomonadota bacterium]